MPELTLSQVKERFLVGESDNLEVIQAQASVVAVHEAYITSLYVHDFAKLELARAHDIIEKDVKYYLGEM